MDNLSAEFSLELPPIWPDIKTELKEYIVCLDNLPIYKPNSAQCYWSRKPNILSLLDSQIAPLGTTLKFNCDPISGKQEKICEVVLKSAGETARNSMSMSRAPGPASECIRGNTSNIPFFPGGFDEPEMLEDSTIEEIDFENNLRTLAKGFSVGIEFKSDNCTPKEASSQEEQLSKSEKSEIEEIADKINLMSIVNEEQNTLGLWLSEFKDTKEEESKESLDAQEQSFNNIVPFLEEANIPVIKISEKPAENTKSVWAEKLDVSVPVVDFEKRIPELAMNFPYELDTFQKQAILKLEENCNVFVAAHTSAGKTTVAEYAIALSQKHMTRVIYTSPIKALSNQKYREFKRKFDSVGLLTGELQINSNATCVIMTTEILKAMLYCASEILRDLEFVIFDEVHYINDDDRGHVWEESVILLPKTVTIVMLSATVPNPLVFADWVGRIKKKKMYVITTSKRPVPLEHYLYTGINGKTRNDKFLVLDERGQFLLDGWNLAVSTKELNSKAKEKKRNTNSKMTPQQEKVLWNAFISHIKSQKMMPVVIFMLSRKRCDMSAVLLRNVNLTTESEKYIIRKFFRNNIKDLKGSDRQLPQVLMMQELLQNGIGIHHSGILPILKEIVEMLFQKGIVKLLFATETFAMGVNMPARTVVFDSIKKYDGTNFRILHATEYIQMAGRAGRRGHDTTGMVIVMCRTAVPHYHELNAMMCSQARKLESKFKVTYSMVLNLRRVNESVSVEAMMRRSFKESPLAIQQNSYKAQLQKVEEELSKLPPLTEMQRELCEFEKVATDYLEYLKYLKVMIFETQKKDGKAMAPGRILLISFENHYNKLALLLASVLSKNTRQYKVLTFTNLESSQSVDFTSLETPQVKNSRWYDIIALTKKELYIPSGITNSVVLTIPAWNVLKITSQKLRLDCNSILASWEKRQLSNNRNKSTDVVTETATQQLMQILFKAAHDPSILEPYVEMEFNYDINTKMQHLHQLKQKVYDMDCIEMPNFEEQFQCVFERTELENKRKTLQLRLSDEELSLYPEYTNAVALLKDLRYIDNDERVALKGRVALHMGSNELLITELILKNVLTVLQPSEIAALLSTLIFQQRTNVKPNVPPTLKKGCDELTEIFTQLKTLEQHYQLETLQPLNFGLVEVVYDWGQSKSFTEIMEKTDLQEGVIVRCIQQLNETLRDVKNAAMTIGDPVLKEKMEEASTTIKRDIVFTPSLYTQD